MNDIAYLQKEKLNMFLDWTISPILELNFSGEIRYLNLAIRSQFPDLRKLGKNHPLLVGLLEEISALQEGSKLIVFSRDINYLQHSYEQQIFSIPELNSIFICVNEVTQSKKIQNIIKQKDDELKILADENKEHIQLIKEKFNKIHLKQNREIADLSSQLQAAELGTWEWNLLLDVISINSNGINLDDLILEKFFSSKKFLTMIERKNKFSLIKNIRSSQNENRIFNSMLNIKTNSDKVSRIYIRGKISELQNDQPIQMSGVFFVVN